MTASRSVLATEAAQQNWDDAGDRDRIVAELSYDIAFEFNVLPDGTLRLTWLSPPRLDFVGYTVEELSEPATWLKVVHPDDRAEALAQAAKLLRGEEEVSDRRVIARNGDIRWFRRRARPMWNEDRSRVVRIVGVAWDVTTEKQAAQALHESEEHFRKFAAQAPVGIFRANLQGKTVYANPELCEIAGRTEEELLRDWSAAVHPQDRARLVNQVAAVLEGRGRFPSEYRIQRPGGDLRWVVGYAVAEVDESGRTIGYMGTVLDITRRKLAEDSLRESEARWRSLVEHAPDFVTVVDREATILYQNRSLSDVSPESLIGTSMLDLVLPAWRELVRDDLERVFRTGRSVSHEVEGLGGRDAKAWYVSQIVPIPGADEVARALIITRDITTHREAEEALRAAEARWRLLLENVPDYVLEVERTGRVVFLNRTQVGIPAEDIRGARIGDLALPRWRAIVEEALQRVFELGEPANYECMGPGVSGKTAWYACRLAPLDTLSRDGKAILIGRDVTDEKRATEDLRRTHDELAQRGADLARTVETLHREIRDRERIEMALRQSRSRARALSERLLSAQEEERRAMAREIHDELGQALTAMRLDVSWVKKRIGDGPEDVVRRLDHARDLIDDTIGSVRRLAASLRPGVLDDLGLVAAVEWQLSEFRSQAGLQCELTVEPAEMVVNDGIAVTLFRVFQEAMTNVVRHAGASHVRVDLRRTAKNVTLLVEDNGRGIRTQEFDDPGSLGLLGIRERVRLCGGRLRVQGKAGRGTLLRVVIPVTGGRKRAGSLESAGRQAGSRKTSSAKREH